MWIVAIYDPKSQPRRKQGHHKQLKVVIFGARRNVSPREAQALEELIAYYQDVFESKSGDKWCTYHCIESDDTRPIRHPLSRPTLTKQAEVNVMMEGMKNKGVVEESEYHRLL